MKFTKKLGLATSSGAVPYDHFPDSTFTDTLLFFCSRSLAKLSRAWKWKRKSGHANQKIINTRPAWSKNAHVIDWAPLVKAASSIETGNNKNSQIHLQNCSDYSLAGQSVLCVGGRIKLYPQYGQSIKDYGGCFIAFHGDSHDNLADLPPFLEQADMIICPVDCINHEAFFTVKYYCKYSGKPCVLLDRSEINTFNAGIRMLVAMTAQGQERIYRMNQGNIDITAKDIQT